MVPERESWRDWTGASSHPVISVAQTLSAWSQYARSRVGPSFVISKTSGIDCWWMLLPNSAIVQDLEWLIIYTLFLHVYLYPEINIFYISTTQAVPHIYNSGGTISTTTQAEVGIEWRCLKRRLNYYDRGPRGIQVWSLPTLATLSALIMRSFMLGFLAKPWAASSVVAFSCLCLVIVVCLCEVVDRCATHYYCMPQQVLHAPTTYTYISHAHSYSVCLHITTWLHCCDECLMNNAMRVLDCPRQFLVGACLHPDICACARGFAGTSGFLVLLCCIGNYAQVPCAHEAPRAGDRGLYNTHTMHTYSISHQASLSNAR